jgi:hypothetical protein
MRAAEARYNSAMILARNDRRLAALYFYGYSVEMCLSAAYYRSAGFNPNVPIARDVLQRRMAQARQLRTARGEPLMNSDPHPLVGWARFLEWQQIATYVELAVQRSQRLREAINKAAKIYDYWRPDLRYKTIDVDSRALTEVHRAASWFLENRERL